MNYWLRQSELKDMAKEFMSLFSGKIFSAADIVIEYFNKIKGQVYRNHSRIKGELSIKIEIAGLSSIVEKLTGKQYWVVSIGVEDFAAS